MARHPVPRLRAPPHPRLSAARFRCHQVRASRFPAPDGSGLPFDFVAAEYLIALGVAHWGRSSEPKTRLYHARELSAAERITCHLCGQLLVPPRVLREDGRVTHLACQRADQARVDVERERAALSTPVDPQRDPDQLYLDPHALAAYAPPLDASDRLVLAVGDLHHGARMCRTPTGTRITPTAAYCLWAARSEAERDGLLNASGWCSRCGRHFIDRRASLSDEFEHGGLRRLGHLRIPAHCPDCRKLRTKRLPPVRQCAAQDCERWFEPTDGKHVFHSAACARAESRRHRLAA